VAGSNLTPRVGVLAIQGDFEAHAAALTRAGAEPVMVRSAEQLESLNGLIIPGGESTTFLQFFERNQAGQKLWDSLKAFSAQKPTFGTCAGCILLASEVTGPAQTSLGALDATVQRNAYGRQLESAIVTGPTKLDGDPLEMVYIRAPRITRVGDTVEVLAERDGFPVLVRSGNVLAATFHPELSDNNRVHDYFVKMVRDNAAKR
jgi:5'-phosphate synthase pdxT subunit